MRFSLYDRTIVGAYFFVVLAIGFVLRRRIHNSADYLLTDRSLPLWVTGIAFMAANLGSLEMLGMVASSAKYGMIVNQYYWIGAIPPMVFLGTFMMPFYYRNNIRSVPEYLKVRFDARAHALNALTFTVMTILMSGINMFALAIVFKTMLGWSFNGSVLISAAVVMAYTSLGGLSSSIYNEVLQFFLIVAGFLPLSFFSFRAAGGWRGLHEKLAAPMLHTWRFTASGRDNAMGANWFAISFGLGFVMSFAYWCTDFLLVQRAMAARSLIDARRTPLVAAIPKMLFPVLVTLPGLSAAAIFGSQLKADYNAALPMLLERFYGSGLLGLGLVALLASFMSGMAGNITAFNTILTYDLYQDYLAPGKTEQHYLIVARLATIVGAILSIATAYIVLRFNNLMDYMQLIASIFISPMFATFSLGIFWRRTNGTGAFYGMISGIIGSFGHYLVYRTGLLHYKTPMAADFYGAMAGWTAAMFVTILFSLITPPPPNDKLGTLVYCKTATIDSGVRHWYNSVGFQGVCILAGALILNILFW
jgi:solute:Na+ symporter, SSS family